MGSRGTYFSLILVVFFEILLHTEQVSAVLLLDDPHASLAATE